MKASGNVGKCHGDYILGTPATLAKSWWLDTFKSCAPRIIQNRCCSSEFQTGPDTHREPPYILTLCLFVYIYIYIFYFFKFDVLMQPKAMKHDAIYLNSSIVALCVC